MRLLVATRSVHKLDEIRQILAGVAGLQLIGLDEVDGLPPDPPDEELEPFDTFEENALSKARWYRHHSGLPTVADDSGLVVDALDGAPGVRSKRFAPGEASGAERDRANNTHLLRLLDGVDTKDRTARYVCVVAFVDGSDGPGRGDAGEPAELTFRGTVEGRIAEEPRGEGGFGYDPLFHVPELGRTFGEADPAEKHARSHRGEAFRKLARHLGGGS